MQREKGTEENQQKNQSHHWQRSQSARGERLGGEGSPVLENEQDCLLRNNISATSNCSRMANCPNSIKFLFLTNSGEESSVMKPTASRNNCEPM